MWLAVVAFHVWMISLCRCALPVPHCSLLWMNRAQILRRTSILVGCARWNFVLKLLCVLRAGQMGKCTWRITLERVHWPVSKTTLCCATVPHWLALVDWFIMFQMVWLHWGSHGYLPHPIHPSTHYQWMHRQPCIIAVQTSVIIRR